MIKKNTSYTEKYQDHIPCSFAYKIVCIGDRFRKPVVLYRGKIFLNLLKQLLKSMIIAKKKMIEKRFNKTLIVCKEDKKRSHSSNKCWICNKLFVADDNKVRDHDHVTGKYRRSAHWRCNINLKLTKKVPVIFHNLKGYDSHLIMQETVKFDVKALY